MNECNRSTLSKRVLGPGFPDRFVRYNGRRLFVHRRKDDPDIEFKAIMTAELNTLDTLLADVE